MAAVMLFGLAVFFFVFGVLPYWFKLHKHLNEILGCWALTFPNIGWIATLRVLGDTFGIRGFFTLHLILVIALCITYVILAGFTAYAFYRGEIFYAKPEDVVRDAVGLPDPEKGADSHGHGHGHGHQH
jgi:tellurite resistance protein TehA-like permease